jgi:hypothetical protein
MTNAYEKSFVTGAPSSSCEMEQKKNKVIKFESSCSIQSMENSIRNPYNGNTDADFLLLDMKDINWIEVQSIIFLIAYIDKKQSKNEKIKIELPRDIKIRNFIRFFRLPSVLSSLTGKKFQDLVTTESLQYFGENIKLRGDYRNFQLKKYLNYDSFAEAIAENDIRTYSELYQFKTDTDKSYSYEKLLAAWNCAAMKAFLKKYLESQESNKERLVPNRIISECITNSQRHSKADKLMVSFIVKKELATGGNNSNNVLHISFWDNGDSIIKTLKDAINKGKPIIDADILNDSKINTVQSSYYIKYENDTFDKAIIDSDINLTEIIDDDGLILLSSFFPGISEDPKGLHQFTVNDDFKEEDTPLKKPGMGLTILLNAAIDLLGGEISVRAENCFLNIKKPGNNAIKKYETQLTKHNKYYEVRIKKYDENVPFNGNMLTIRLPLKGE